MKNYYTIISDNGVENYNAQTYSEAMLYCYQLVVSGMSFSTKILDCYDGEVVFELDAKKVLKNIVRKNDHKKLGLVCCVTKRE